MDKKLLQKLVGDAIANTNYKRMSSTGKAAEVGDVMVACSTLMHMLRYQMGDILREVYSKDEAREQLEELKALQKSIQNEDFGSGQTTEDDIMVNIEVPFSCLPLLNDALDKAIADCDKTIDGKRKAKKLLDIQIALMGGKNGK